MANRDKSPQLGLSDDKLELLVRDLTKKRGTLKGRLTKFGTYVNSFDANVATPQNKIDLKLRIEGATNLYREFNSIQSRIEECVNEADLDDQLTQREQFEDCYYSTLSQAELLVNRCDGSSSGKVTTCSKTCENIQLRSVKLPTITLPSFDGSYEHWLEFRDTFQSLVHDSDEITSIQKFHYLKSSLKGSAELVIDALEFTSDNYSVAWDLLLNRYNNSRLLVHNHIKSIFNIQPLSKESSASIRTLSDTILKNIRALKILGEPVDSWHSLVIYIMVSKLDKTTEREWEQHKGTLITNNNDSKLKLKVDDLINFLKNRADMLETLQGSHSSQINKESKDTKNNLTNRSNEIDRTKLSTKCNVSTTKPHDRHSAPKNCIMCNGLHQLYACSQFINSNLESKLKFLRDRKLCENCMKNSSHTAEFCKFGGCRRCFKKHNSLIHPSDDLNHPPGDTKPIGNTSGSLTMHSTFDNQQLTGAGASVDSSPTAPLLCPADAVFYANNAHSDKRTHRSLRPVLLSTALIEVRARNNVYLLANALLDNGSERSFITEAFSKKLGVELLQSTHEIRGVGNSVTQCTKSCDIEIKSRISTYATKLHCFVLPQISTTLPAVHYERARFHIPNSLQLADPHFIDSRKIDILIGADIFWELIHEGNIRLPNGPYLQNTHLGWIISGPIVLNTRNNSLIQCNFTQSIDTQLRQFWEIEEFPRDRDRTDAEHACEELFTRTTTRNDEGRFIVSIPLKSSPLGESLPQAERRFLALEKRLERAPAYKKLYADFLHEYDSLGHMTRVSTYGTPHYFMPHHGVFRENHSSTRLRVVYDAGAVSSSGISYNDLQLVGPPIQGDLISIILRFRQHRYVACADIEKMYRQCLIDETQRDLQLILWRDEPTQPLGVYRLNTVTYGTASAPFLSCRCLKQLAIETTNSEVSRIINEDFYVDDMITGSDDKEVLIKLCEETTKTLQAGCFPLLEYKSISNKRALKNKHNLSKLNLFIDEDKLLRVGGRLDYSEFDYNKKHPILLSSKHHYTLLLFRHEHKSLLHAAPQALLFHLQRCSSDIIEYANQQKIKFKFIVPYASHMSGLWERGVRSCKYHLRRVVGNAHLTYEEFSTVLAQVEAVLNSRPLTPMSSDPNDFLPLSPAHFLVGRTLTAPAYDNLEDTPTHRLDRYQRVEQIRQHFWRRWSKEYISELQTRTKWRENTRDLKPNAMVIIKEDNFPPLRWHLGRVIRNIPGKDGISRVAEIQTASGLVRRAYTKICPLVDPDEDSLGSSAFQGRGHVSA
ncbi:uncharacterized protein [Maniola hyperantus]|uniref:uncharacterized protein n=1 Tax=Aphantopus hyperantus TaxID=2795564 RepID=UPI00374A59CB